MQFSFSDEQAQFRDVVARFCRDKAPAPQVRRTIDTERGFEPDLWRQFAAELGVVGIHVPEEAGGAGFGAVELGIVMEELGRSLAPLPYLSSVLATTALAQGDEGAGELMAAVVGGRQIVTLVLEGNHGEPLARAIEARDGKLHGSATAVLDGHCADAVLVVSSGAGGRRDAATRATAAAAARPTLYAVRTDTPGLTRKPLRTMDGTRRMARLTFEGCAATALGTLGNGQVRRIYDTALVALANEMVGGARALLESTLEYTKLRVQFGRPIGSFQAIKHRLADLHTDVELARAAAYQAAQALAGDDEPAVNASLAKAVASEAYMQAAREAIQLRGGIGFTWENDTHLWYRRAKSSEVLLGTPAYHRERMLRELEV